MPPQRRAPVAVKPNVARSRINLQKRTVERNSINNKANEKKDPLQQLKDNAQGSKEIYQNFMKN